MPHSDSLLAVFAHPDDESLAAGGVLAWCASLGVRVTLLCVTHGEHGQRVDEANEAAVPAGALGELRATELHDAARVLGVSEVIMLGYEDGMLPWVDASRLEADIRDVIGRVRPDVVVTFGEDGLYWHPDHIAVYERTTAAVASLQAMAPALYYVTLPAGAMRAVVDHVAHVASTRPTDDPAPDSILGVADPDAFGDSAAAPTLVVRTGAFSQHKLRALRCHQSQLTNCALALVDVEDAPRLLGIEHYRRAEVGAQGATLLERLVVNPR